MATSAAFTCEGWGGLHVVLLVCWWIWSDSRDEDTKFYWLFFLSSLNDFTVNVPVVLSLLLWLLAEWRTGAVVMTWLMVELVVTCDITQQHVILWTPLSELHILLVRDDETDFSTAPLLPLHSLLTPIPPPPAPLLSLDEKIKCLEDDVSN